MSKIALAIHHLICKRTEERNVYVKKKLQGETNRDIFQSHVSVALGQSNFGNLHADAGLKESLSDFCKLLADSATGEFGTDTRTHRNYFDENNDIIREKFKSKNKTHDLSLKNPTTANINAFTV